MKFGITHKTLLFATVAVMFLFSASLLLMPISVQLSFRGKTALMLINGAWFWLGGIASVILFVITNMKREKKPIAAGLKNSNSVYLSFSRISGQKLPISHYWEASARLLFL